MKIIDVPPKVLELLTLAEGAPAADWGKPEPLTHGLKPVPPLIDDMLPPPLRPWIKDVAHRMQCPIDFVAAAAITALGAVVGTGCTVRPKQLDNWKVVPNLWGAVVAQPGSKKSPAIGQAFLPLNLLDHEAQEAFAQDFAKYQMDKEVRELEISSLKSEIKKLKPGQLGPATPGGPPARDPRQELQILMQTPLPEPKRKRYLTNDCTFESLGEILRVNTRGVLLFHDELTGWINGFERAGREGERQGYLTAWNGLDSHHVDRIARGSIYIERLCVSVFGGIQPDMLEHYLYEAKSAHRNDGLVQRLQLLVYPDVVTSTVLVDDTPDLAATSAAKDIFKVLAGELTNLAQASPTDGVCVHFEAYQAQARFNQWYIDLHLKINNDDDNLIKEHLSKYTKLILALALLFHLVDIAADMSLAGQPIPLATLERALAWADYLEAHARRIYSMTTDYAIRAGIMLASKIRRGALSDGFKVRDIQQKGWSGLNTAEEIKAACDELVAANWIRSVRAERTPSGVGRKPAASYIINPQVIASESTTGMPTKPTKRTRRKPAKKGP